MDRRLCRFEPLPRFRESFERAAVQDIRFVKNYLADAEFSNDVHVMFFGDGGTWTIIEPPADPRPG
jgi:hypothetical protein